MKRHLESVPTTAERALLSIRFYINAKHEARCPIDSLAPGFIELANRQRMIAWRHRQDHHARTGERFPMTLIKA